MSNSKITVGDIDASLTSGQFFLDTMWRAILIVMISFTVIGIMAYISYVVVSIFDNSIDIIMTVIPGILFLLFGFLCWYLIYKWSRQKKQVALWLEDSVILEAQVKSLGQTVQVRNLIARTATAIEVCFEYNGKRYTRQSTYKDKPLYLAVYTKYANNKKVMIAYSHKYDEVMLIKPTSIQRLK